LAYLPNTPHLRAEMLSALGVESAEELIDRQVPGKLKFQGLLNLPAPLSEMELLEELERDAACNQPAGEMLNFLGAGVYDHFVPSAVQRIISRSEFYTSYTAYQPEASQGMLQATYEYQSLICALTGMDVANASNYDGATSLAEAAILCMSATGRRGIVLSGAVHPAYRKVVETYTKGLGSNIRTVPTPDGVTDPNTLGELLAEARSGEEPPAAVVIQHPNYFGCLEDVSAVAAKAHDAGALCVVCVNPISLGILVPPGSCGADVVVGEGQPLGSPMNYGGPLLGIFACREEHVRRMPGRIIGATTDAHGRRAYCMTLQTREQHIRRERATSNICTNEALVALAAAVYLSLMGKHGLRRVAELCLQKAHYAARRISELRGYKLAFSAPFFNEFTVETPVPASRIVSELSQEGILPGRDLSLDFAVGNNGQEVLKDARRPNFLLLVCVTERRTKAQIDRLVEALSRYQPDSG
jgi:glycine dehydrogenase subunit 1